MKKFAALLLSLVMMMVSVAALAETLVMATNAEFEPWEYKNLMCFCSFSLCLKPRQSFCKTSISPSVSFAGFFGSIVGSSLSFNGYFTPSISILPLS